MERKFALAEVPPSGGSFIVQKEWQQGAPAFPRWRSEGAGRVDDYGDDYGLRLKLVSPCTVVVRRKGGKSEEEGPGMANPLHWSAGGREATRRFRARTASPESGAAFRSSPNSGKSLSCMIACMLLTAFGVHASPIASESFGYRPGTPLTDGRAGGGSGWAGGWQSADGMEIYMAGEQASLWFGNTPAYNQDGTGHMRGRRSDCAIRDWSTPVDLQTSDLYFSALIRISEPDSNCRLEFYDGSGASGNMRMNVGLNDYDGDGNVDLFVDADDSSYPVGATSNTATISTDATYLLVGKRDRHSVSASLLPANAVAPLEPTVWDVTQSNSSDAVFQSLKFTVSTNDVRFDELCIATNFAEAVAGLQAAVETNWFLTYPLDGETVYQTIPYFEWTDAVPHPYAGTYHIQIAEGPGFTELFDEDTIPALISWYSPTVEFERGSTYYWRVRYGDEAWSSPNSFSIGFPHVIDVLPSDGWDEIQAKYAQTAAFGYTNAQAAELRFPTNHTFNLVQNPVDDYLLDYPGDGGNFIINGQGSTLILERTQPYHSVSNTRPKCGFWTQRPGQSDIQIHDIVIDYHPNSLGQFGGVITNLNKNTGTFTVMVDTNVYANFHEASTIDQGTFMYAENQGRVQDDTWVYMKQTWAEARQNDTTFNFTFDSTPVAALKAELNNGDYFISSPVPDRGGQMFHLDRNMSDNFLANNVTTKACRGIMIRGIPYHGRFVNCNFVRAPGRLRGGASGGVNHQTDYGWYENVRFEYMRDDSFHNGGTGAESASPGEIVFRNNEVVGGYRASIWGQMDRQWIADNIVRHAGGNAIFIGRSGTSNTENDQMDVGLIENNQLFGVRGGFVSGAHTTAEPDPVTGMFNQYLTIRNNSICDTTKDQAFELAYLKNCIVESNRVCSTISGWSAFSDPALQIGFHFDNSRDITGAGNSISDKRLDLAGLAVIESSCRGITVEVIDNRFPPSPSDYTRQYAPVADAYVRDGAPTRNYGTTTYLRSKHDPGGNFSRWSYLRFESPDVRGILQRVTLRLKVVDLTASGDTRTVHQVNDSWGETSITWSNRPALGIELASSSQGTVGEWLEFDLTDHFDPGEAPPSFAVVSDGGELISFGSRETGSDAPQLVVLTSWDYARWASEHGLAQGPDGDDDSDGMINLAEYAFVGTPTNELDRGIAPGSAVTEVGGTNWFHYVYPQRTATNSGLRYVVEWTKNLASNDWHEVAVAPVVSSNSWEMVTNLFPMIEKDQQFFRLKVELQ